MATSPLTAVLRFLRKVAQPDGAADADLLRRFVTSGDEHAFAALLERHGPMVLGVCRRILREPHDADDAFQATFLVLARKARSVTRPELLAGWLYRVAYRTALRAQLEAARRHRHEREAGAMPRSDATSAAEWADIRPVLDEEIDRLPEKFRLPVVLCYLEGVTNDEAARRLGCPPGTIVSRLATARQRLRARLTRRGVTLSASALVPLLAENASATVPTELLAATARAAGLAAAGQSIAGVVSVKAIILTEGVLKTMLLHQILKTASLTLVAVVLVSGTGLLVPAWPAQGTAVPEEKAQPSARAPKAAAEVASVEEIFEAFQDNDALADEKFTDKRVRVKGSVLQIRRFTKGQGGYVLTMTAAAPEDVENPPPAGPEGAGGLPGGPGPMGPGRGPAGPGIGQRPGMPGFGPGAFGPQPSRQVLSFTFSKDDRKELAQLRSGQNIVVEGRCGGMIQEDEGAGTIRFFECKILPAPAKRGK